MDRPCVLCSTEYHEEAHVRARASFPEGEHRVQNLIPLCPLCHELFDSYYITIHPEYRIFVFSLCRERKNLFRAIDYAYPHTESLDSLRQVYLDWQAKNEFKRTKGASELAQRFPVRPPIQRVHIEYVLG
jgi:hypothetical protein